MELGKNQIQNLQQTSHLEMSNTVLESLSNTGCRLSKVGYSISCLLKTKRFTASQNSDKDISRKLLPWKPQRTTLYCPERTNYVNS